MMRNDLDLTLYLIRHGQTQRNVESDIIGQDPSEPLNETGQQQAQKLAARFKKENTNFDYIYTSPYKRTVETTEIVFADQIGLGQQYTTVPALREIYQGDGRGKSRKALYSDKEFVDYCSYVGMSFRFDGKGESLMDVEYRVKKWLEDSILNNAELPANKPLNMAMIGHAMNHKTALHYVMNFDHKICWRIACDNSSITKLRVKDGEWFILGVNDTSHLRD